MELSGEFPVKLLCETMGIQRSSFYNWKKHLSNPSDREKSLVNNITLFREYHMKYPSHGYRWLNAKIRLDTGQVMSDPYAHKCCRAAGIKSKSKHYRYKKAGEPARVFPNLLLSEMQIDGPYQCIVSDMTAFSVKGVCYELTLYMDLWNDEIVSHSLSAKRGDRMTYISGLEDVIEIRKQHPENNREQSTLPRLTMTFCRCTESHDPCPGQEHQPTTRRWKRSTGGSKQNCSQISTSPERNP